MFSLDYRLRRYKIKLELSESMTNLTLKFKAIIRANKRKVFEERHDHDKLLRRNQLLRKKKIHRVKSDIKLEASKGGE